VEAITTLKRLKDAIITLKYIMYLGFSTGNTRLCCDAGLMNKESLISGNKFFLRLVSFSPLSGNDRSPSFPRVSTRYVPPKMGERMRRAAFHSLF
jgi:hypothetical protein